MRLPTAATGVPRNRLCPCAWGRRIEAGLGTHSHQAGHAAIITARASSQTRPAPVAGRPATGRDQHRSMID